MESCGVHITSSSVDSRSCLSRSFADYFTAGSTDAKVDVFFEKRLFEFVFNFLYSNNRNSLTIDQ